MDLKLLILLNCFGNISSEKAGEYSHIISEASVRYKVEDTLILATMMRESRCIVSDVNPKSGASGLMQLLPSTATGELLGTRIAKKVSLTQETLSDPIVSITLGTKYLARLIKKCRSINGGLSMYNGRGTCESSSYSIEVLAIQEKLNLQKSLNSKACKND